MIERVNGPFWYEGAKLLDDQTHKRVVILGGGLAGYSIARSLGRRFSETKMHVVLVDSRDKMAYQPFLAEVVSGCVEARHIQVPLEQNLPFVQVINAKVKSLHHESKIVYLEDNFGCAFQISYDIAIVTLGSVTKTLPIPGLKDNAIGLKTVEEAVYIRDALVNAFRAAESLRQDDPLRAKLLTSVVVGGGLTGIECAAAMATLYAKLTRHSCAVSMDDVRIHLIEAADKIIPELPRQETSWALDRLEMRGVKFHLNTFVEDVSDQSLKASDGTKCEYNLLVWAAGQTANPVLESFDLPLDEQGRITCNAKLQVVNKEGQIVEGAFACGDIASVPDLSRGSAGDLLCAPTAQHAVRQAKVLSYNVVAMVNKGALRDYSHKNAGCVVDLGRHLGILSIGDNAIICRGYFAWIAHRVYHGLALPTLSRKLRVWCDWSLGLFAGPDVVSTYEVLTPRSFFESYATQEDGQNATEYNLQCNATL